MNQGAYQKALKILLNRPHFEAELRNKLISKNISHEDIEPILEDLKKRKYINDDEQAKLYIAELSRKGFGSYYIVNKLAQKGIDYDKAQSLVDKLFDKDIELENIRKIISKKRIDLKKLSDINEKKKLFDFLKNRGFSIEQIMNVIKV